MVDFGLSIGKATSVGIKIIKYEASPNSINLRHGCVKKVRSHSKQVKPQTVETIPFSKLVIAYTLEALII